MNDQPTDQRPFKTTLLALLSRWTKLVAIASLVLTLLAQLSAHHLLLELTSHFHWQYFLALFASSLIFALLKKSGWLLLAVAGTLINVIALAPFLPVDAVTAPRASISQPGIKLLHANVLASNDDFAALLDLVKQEQPDILSVQELSPEWATALEALHTDYPHRRIVPAENNFGIALLSKIPSEMTATRSPTTGEMWIRADFAWHGQTTSLIASHPPPPINATLYRVRNTHFGELAAAARLAATTTTQQIILGDLNVGLWSADFAQLETASGLTSCRNGWGLTPTWPAPLGVLGIPIDHCLISERLRVIELRTGPNIGSDHLPLIVKLKTAGTRHSPDSSGTSGR